MRESALEKKLMEAVKELGGLHWKFVSPGTAGVPDRICVFPGGRVVFVEMKAPGEKLRPLQAKRAQEILDREALVWLIDSEEGINAFVEWNRQ